MYAPLTNQKWPIGLGLGMLLVAVVLVIALAMASNLEESEVSPEEYQEVMQEAGKAVPPPDCPFTLTRAQWDQLPSGERKAVLCSSAPPL